jgi:hypothetical protein
MGIFIDEFYLYILSFTNDQVFAYDVFDIRIYAEVIDKALS